MSPRRNVKKSKSFMGRLNFALFTAAMFFFAGYGLTYLTRELAVGPALTMPVAALGAMWVGSRVGRPMRAAAAGMALGAIAGLGTSLVLVTLLQQPRHDVPMLAAMDAVSATGNGLVLRPVMMAQIASAEMPLSVQNLQIFVGRHMLAAAGFCGLAATLTGLSAQRRRQRIERQWTK